MVTGFVALAHPSGDSILNAFTWKAHFRSKDIARGYRKEKCIPYISINILL